MWNKILGFLKDPSGIQRLGHSIHNSKSEVIHELRQGIKELKEELARPIEDVVKEYKEKLSEAEERAEFYCMSLENLGDVIPDMLWFKYLDGTYAYTNKAIRDGLLFNANPVGKTDADLGNSASVKFGSDNHDFGLYCAGSDVLTIEYGHRKRFIEYGMSGGIPLVLEVYKNVVRNSKDEIIGTVGSGRDITKMMFTMLEMAEYNKIDDNEDNACSILKKYLDEYLYENGSSEGTLKEFYLKHKDTFNGR